MDKKKIIIASIVLLVLAVILLIIFINKSKNDSKKNEDESNYSLNFKFYNNEDLKQNISFIYEDKQLSNIKLTLYFGSKAAAENVCKEYKKEEAYKDCSVKKTNAVLNYSESEVKGYSTYTKEEIIQEFTSRGYVYRK